MWSWLKKVFTGAKSVFVRTGLDKFLKSNFELALQVITRIIAENPGKSLHELRDLFFAAIQQATGIKNGNWIVMIISVVVEHLKAREAGVSRITIN